MSGQTSCILTPLRSSFSSCQPLIRSTIYPWRHSVGSDVSRIGLWEFYHEMKIICEDGLLAIGHCSKNSLYHIIVRRARSNQPVNQVKRKITAVYTIYRDKNEQTINQLWTRLCPIVNALFPFLRRRLHVTELRILKEIVKVTRENDSYKPVHVATKLQFVSVFKRKNTVIMKSLDERTFPIGQTPLMMAIEFSNLVLVRALVDLGANLLAVNCRADSILHYAALSSVDVFKYIVEKIKSKYNLVKMLRIRNNKGYTPLHWCCYSGQVDNLLELLKTPMFTSLLVLEPNHRVHTSDSKQDIKSSSEELSLVIKYHDSDVSTSGSSNTCPANSPTISSSGSSSRSSTISDTMISFTSEMIDDLDTREMILGGSPMHWSTTRRLLERLLEANFSLESINFNHETPLHVMVRQRRLKCAVMLLSHGVDVSSKDNKGNTALHRAVQKEDISMVQGLIAFDADINSLNGRNQTPRHIAATKDSSISKIIVNVLHRVGAKRCPPKRKKCTENCAHNAKGTGTPFPKWANYDDESPYVDFMNFSRDKPEIAIQRSLSKMNKDKIKAQPARMICLDGGGSRGLFTCCALIEIERRLKKPIREYFEWFVGTSSGALIASLIVLGTPLNQVRSMYYQFKDKIFVGPRPYDSVLLEKLMKEKMGSRTKMTDIKDDKKLLITAVLTRQNPAQLYLFRNIPSPDDIVGRKAMKDAPECIINYKDQLIWQACRASGAAPSYFSAFGPFIDGGILANNPTLDAMSEFFHFNNALINVGRESEAEQLALVVSMGTGKPPNLPARLVDLGPIMTTSLFTLPEAIKTALSLQELLNMMINTALQTDGHVNARAEAWCSSLSIPYFRLNPPMSEDLLLNETEDIEIVNGMWETKAYMYAISPYLDKLVRTLEAVDRNKPKR